MTLFILFLGPVLISCFWCPVLMSCLVWDVWKWSCWDARQISDGTFHSSYRKGGSLWKVRDGAAEPSRVQQERLLPPANGPKHHRQDKTSGHQKQDITAGAKNKIKIHTFIITLINNNNSSAAFYLGWSALFSLRWTKECFSANLSECWNPISPVWW